jgi:hypothetical protein
VFADETQLAGFVRDWDRFEPQLTSGRREDLRAGWQLALADAAAAREAAIS